MLRLLLIEDSELVLRAMRRLLGRAYVVVTAANGRKALHLIKSGERFDVILGDVAKPVMNSVEFYNRSFDTRSSPTGSCLRPGPLRRYAAPE